MKLRGRAHRFGDDINTDYIIAGKYKSKYATVKEQARHVMEDLDPNFYEKISPGDFIVAGSNFGCGSSRETAPLVIRYANLSAVLAKSFARIFFRNAINTGLPVLRCNTDLIDNGDQLEVDLSAGVVRDLTKGLEINAAPLPGVMITILNDGGLVEHYKKHKGFAL